MSSVRSLSRLAITLLFALVLSSCVSEPNVLAGEGEDPDAGQIGPTLSVAELDGTAWFISSIQGSDHTYGLTSVVFYGNTIELKSDCFSARGQRLDPSSPFEPLTQATESGCPADHLQTLFAGRVTADLDPDGRLLLFGSGISLVADHVQSTSIHTEDGREPPRSFDSNDEPLLQFLEDGDDGDRRSLGQANFILIDVDGTPVDSGDAEYPYFWLQLRGYIDDSGELALTFAANNTRSNTDSHQRQQRCGTVTDGTLERREAASYVYLPNRYPSVEGWGFGVRDSIECAVYPTVAYERLPNGQVTIEVFEDHFALQTESGELAYFELR